MLPTSQLHMLKLKDRIQLFPILTPEQDAALSAQFEYERWGVLEDGRVAVRFVTSWATTEAEARTLADAIEAL